MRKGILLTVLFLFGSFLYAVPGAEASAGGSCSPGVTGDFNDDGTSDLAVAAPKYNVSGNAEAGGVNVLYGSGTGLTGTGSQFWTQDSTGVSGFVEPGDQFGFCLAAGDFDGDGASDLAVGAPAEDVGSIKNAGSVNIIYGSLTGLDGAGSQLWTQDSAAVLDHSEKGDRFGSALAAGDFDGDGNDDLAIGVPFETLGTNAQAGEVEVLFGTGSGLTGTNSQVWRQGGTGQLQGHPEKGDHVGAALAAGDFNGDLNDDLAIGVPLEDLYQDTTDNGVVQVLYSAGAGGLSSTGTQLFHEDLKNVPGVSKSGDQFGGSLAGGDFNNDTFDDLAIGVPLNTDKFAIQGGSLHAFYGSSKRLVISGNQYFRQGSGGVLEKEENDDHFAATLSSGDYNGDGFFDLAIGVPLENGTATDEGGVNVIYGSATALDTTTTPTQFWRQGASAGGTPEASDNFGSAIASGDFNGDTFADLGVGVPREDVGGATDAGAVNVIYGATGNGLDTAGHQLWSQDSTDVAGTAQAASVWGSALG